MRERIARALPAALIGGTGFWLALGTAAPHGGDERLGVLAPWWVLVSLVAAPLAAAALSDEGARRSRAWLLGALGFLPWLPITGVPVLLLWQGPLAAALLATAVLSTFWLRGRSRWLNRAAQMSPARHTTIAILIAVVCYLAAASRMAPILPGGDEPHYLIITQSLLYDGDLAIENNHDRRQYYAYTDQVMKPDYLRRGVDGAIYSIHAPGVSALVAPAFAIGGYPGVVVLLAVLAALGASLVWRAAWYITGDVAAAWIGWASVALSVPFFFQAFTVFPDGPGAVLVMIAAYGLVRHASGYDRHKTSEEAGLARFPKSGVFRLSRTSRGSKSVGSRFSRISPSPKSVGSGFSRISHDGQASLSDRVNAPDAGSDGKDRGGDDLSGRVVTDAPAAAALAVRSVGAIECLVLGSAIALLPWLHTRFSIPATALGLVWMLRVWQGSRSPGRSLTFASIPLASAALWVWSFYAIYGTPNPAAPYGGYTQSSLANTWRGTSGLLIDQQFGLLPNAPVYLAAFAGAWLLWRVRARLACELMAVTIPYALAVASYHMWWGGRSAPARFLVPVLLPAGMAVAVAWHRSALAARALIVALLTGSLALTAVLAIVDRGALLYNARDGYALWLEWIAPLVRLPLAVPSLFQSGGPLAYAWIQALVWSLAAGIAWVVAGWAMRNRAASPADSSQAIEPRVYRFGLAAVAAFVLAVTIGSGLGWTVARADAIDAGSGLWRVARAAGRPGAVGLRLPALRLSEAGTMMAGVSIPAPARGDTRHAPLFVARDIPPGQYSVTETAYVVGDGSIAATVGGGLPPIAVADLSGRNRARPLMTLDLPLGATTLTIDRAAGSTSRSGALALAPVRLTPSALPLARAAMRSNRGVLWLLDDDAWPEPGGLWTRGSAMTTIAADVSGRVPLRLRNGAVKNDVTVRSGSWHAKVRMAPEETHEVDVPVSARLAPITIAAGQAFRPADHDARNGDERLLGVWVEMR